MKQKSAMASLQFVGITKYGKWRDIFEVYSR